MGEAKRKSWLKGGENLIKEGKELIPSENRRRHPQEPGNFRSCCPTLWKVGGEVSLGRGSCVNRGIERALDEPGGETQEHGVAGVSDEGGWEG